MRKQKHGRLIKIVKILSAIFLLSTIVFFISFGWWTRLLSYFQNPVIFWKTYKNMEYKYEIKYPRSLEPKDVENDAYLDFVSFTKDNDVYYVYVTDSDLDEEVERIIAQVEGHVIVNKNKDETITVLGYPSRILEYSTSNTNDNKDTTTVIIDSGKYTYVINSNSELSKKIISSFRFVN